MRRSSKVELDWGGHVLEMSEPAASFNFFTTAVMDGRGEPRKSPTFHTRIHDPSRPFTCTGALFSHRAKTVH
ncbi:hypothetical protein MY4824_008131 [Beauveria thailandica]